jgi:hypothetical protein
VLQKQLQAILVAGIGIRLALRRLDFFKIRSYGISQASRISSSRLDHLDSGFAGLQFNGFAPGLLQDLGGILDALAVPDAVLISLDVIIAFGMPFRLAADQHPIDLEFVVSGLGGSKAPLIGDFDVLEDVNAARVAFVVLGFGQRVSSPVCFRQLQTVV